MPLVLEAVTATPPKVHVIVVDATTNSLLQHTYEGLTRYTRDYKIEPALATSCHSASSPA